MHSLTDKEVTVVKVTALRLRDRIQATKSPKFISPQTGACVLRPVRKDELENENFLVEVGHKTRAASNTDNT